MLQFGFGFGTSSAPPAFDPTTYGTMLAGYDTFSAARVLNGSGVAASNNDVVDQWTDLSGNNRHARQTSNPKRPIFKTNVLNGYGVLDLDGAAQFMEMPSCAGITNGKPGLASVLVHQQVDTSSNYCLFEFETATFAHRFRAYTTPQFAIEGQRLDADAGDQIFSGSGAPHEAVAGTWYISVILWGTVAGQAGWWANSIATSKIKGDGTGLTTFSTAGALTSPTDSGETPVIGAASLYNSQLFKGQIAAAYFFDPTGFDRSGITSGLGTLLGITIS